jgi:type IV secretory pathway component VirB8
MGRYTFNPYLVGDISGGEMADWMNVTLYNLSVQIGRNIKWVCGVCIVIMILFAIMIIIYERK